VRVQLVINCTSPNDNYQQHSDELILNLINSGLVRNHPLSLGLDVTTDGALISAEGKINRWFYTLGAVCKGCLWETTAIPEIRRQALLIAQQLHKSPTDVNC
jgi:uncharacterized NAD(P)/FAD-binding protein YdhS